MAAAAAGVVLVDAGVADVGAGVEVLAGEVAGAAQAGVRDGDGVRAGVGVRGPMYPVPTIMGPITHPYTGLVRAATARGPTHRLRLQLRSSNCSRSLPRAPCGSIQCIRLIDSPRSWNILPGYMGQSCPVWLKHHILTEILRLSPFGFGAFLPSRYTSNGI